MKENTYDVAIIGAGSAGITAYNGVKRAGKNAVLIESNHYGTTCASVGCMPSKLLIQAANVAHTMANADTFGVVVPAGASINARAVFERVREKRDDFVSGTVKRTERIPREFRLKGRAQFTDASTVLVEGDDGPVAVKAGAFIVATGSTPRVFSELDNVRDRLLTSADVFEFNEVPQTLAVLGPGIIGLELGQALQRLGSKVTFFSPFGELGMASDPELRQNIEKVFRQSMDFHLNCQKITTNPADDNQVEITWVSEDGTSHERIFEKLLVTTGRTPNVQNIGLENTGLELDRNGVPVYDRHTMQCGDSNIFIAGDVTARFPLLHEAADEGTIAGTNAANFPDVKKQTRSTPLAIAFTEPQMAVVGPRFEEHDSEAIEIGEASYETQSRAVMMGENQGVVRVYGCRKTDRLLGAEMFAPGAEHLAHLLAWAVQGKLTVDEVLERPFYHPVLEEGLQTALRRLSNKLKKHKDQ